MISHETLNMCSIIDTIFEIDFAFYKQPDLLQYKFVILLAMDWM